MQDITLKSFESTSMHPVATIYRQGHFSQENGDTCTKLDICAMV
jgi:hypothetical protein